jgi:lipopolysaccharide export system protein LptA
MRTLVLAAGVLLLLALAAFLILGKLKNPFNYKELPKRLGIEIQQEANGVTYTQAHGGHTLFKIHASKVVQLKKGNALLHDVKIELYGADGSRVDRIEGSEFEYDRQAGTAKAAGPVEITLMRPGVAPAVAPKAIATKLAPGVTVGGRSQEKPLASAAPVAAQDEIHIKTSGLTFDQSSGVATTSQHVDFVMTQGSGSSMGATYDSQQGLLVLDRAVELTTRRGADTVQIKAQHAEFERGNQLCRLRAATAETRGGKALAGDATILFREDGSAVRLDAVNGFTLTTASGSHLAAPAGRMDFNEHNQPRHAHLEGGVTMDSASASADRRRQMHGSSPTAELEFTPRGELRFAHLERGVEMRSEEQISAGSGAASGPVSASLRASRRWLSPVAEIEFRVSGHSQIEPATVHGTGGVVVTGESQRGNDAAVPSRMAADELTGEFGAASALTAMTGVGHTSVETTTATGVRQSTSGDRLEAHFAAATATGGKPAVTAAASGRSPNGGSLGGAAQIESAVVEGHVVLMQVPAASSAPLHEQGSKAKSEAPAATPLRATAGRAVYEGQGEWLHLTLAPRVEEVGLQMTADKVDVSQSSGDAFARGNVKATWINTGKNETGKIDRQVEGSAGKAGQDMGGEGPVHAIAAEAQLHQATGETTFKGQARLWQQASSISAPLIVLDRGRQTLVARSSDAAEPVRVVLLSAGGLGLSPVTSKDTGTTAGRELGKAPAAREPDGKSTSPSVIRLRGGDLKYSSIERKAVMHGIAQGKVVAEMGAATSTSDEVELLLQPQDKAGGKDGAPGLISSQASGQVERVTARGHVVVSSEDRRGTGEQLVYTGATGEYVLTGTSAVAPRMTDPARGTVTGEALIFHAGDESVSVEGGQRKTSTDTRTPR